MKVETQITLRKFKPRDYQIPILDAFQKGYKNVLAIMPRRAGKDITAFNHCVMECIKRPIMVYYIFPTYAQGKKVIWDGLTISGKRLIDEYVPDALVESKNGQEMKIRFKNGSLLQILGSDNIDSLVGTNPHGIVFSEYALQSPQAYQFLRPVVAANDGWMLFLSTPRGRNHLFDLYNIALANPHKWFVYKVTLDDTKHIPLEEVEHDRRMGIMSEDLIQQEYYVSFERGIENSYYGKYLDKLRMSGQIGIVPWEPDIKVSTAWDIGVNDPTTIIFFQSIGNGTTLRIIDCYSNKDVGLDHYAKVLQNKPYVYSSHIGPHDLKQRTWSDGAITRWDRAAQLGINFIIAPDLSIDDGIEAVWANFNKLWIDENKCKPLISAIENYRREWDDKNQRSSTRPLHNWASNFADALRYLCISLPKIKDGMTAKELDERYMEAVYGKESNLPPIFRQGPPYI